MQSAGLIFRRRLEDKKLLLLPGIYDVFSAKLAAARFEGVFCSGFGFIASAYGLPDVGFLNWRDQTDFAGRIRGALPTCHILVDIDDGFGDEVIASNTICILENARISAVMLEDQKRPRKCGHYQGKHLLPIAEYLHKLKIVLAVRQDLFILARTDAEDQVEAQERAVAYAQAGADGIMVEALRDLAEVRELKKHVNCPIAINLIVGGKTPLWSFAEMNDAGVDIAIFSTPCLFAAQHGITAYLDAMIAQQRLPTAGTVGLRDCNEIVSVNNQ